MIGALEHELAAHGVLVRNQLQDDMHKDQEMRQLKLALGLQTAQMVQVSNGSVYQEHACFLISTP